MRLWTILTEAAWESLNERGFLICDDEALGEEHFLTAYRWMMQQMQERLGPPEAGVRLPLGPGTSIWGLGKNRSHGSIIFPNVKKAIVLNVMCRMSRFFCRTLHSGIRC